MKLIVRWVLAAFSLLLAGCATNGYSDFYREIPGETQEVIEATRVAPAPDEPPLEHVATFDDLATYQRKGYFPIGYSSFSGTSGEDDEDALEVGQMVAADMVVVIHPKYRGSRRVDVPLTLPTATTSQTNGTATVYGSGGSANVYSNSTTTTYGSQTTYIPVTLKRYEYGAVYLVKRRQLLGAQFRDLNNEERSRLQTNRGVVVVVVVDGTPAYESDVLTGDIIVSVDGTPVAGVDGLRQMLQGKHGQLIEMSILRGGSTIVKSLKLLD
jgi:membrane-associated protease RseP (regulator of RpoE activity)